MSKANAKVRAVVHDLERVRREAAEEPRESPEAVLSVLAEARGDGPAALEVVHPLTGVPVDLQGETDALIEALREGKNEAAALRTYLSAIEDEIVRRAPAPEKSRTVYLRGDSREVQVVFERPEAYEQEGLRKAWDNHPAARPFLRVAEYAVNVTAFDKALKTNGNAEFEAAKAALLKAQRPNTRRPRVVVKS